jgi:hypothetical protein
MDEKGRSQEWLHYERHVEKGCVLPGLEKWDHAGAGVREKRTG